MQGTAVTVRIYDAAGHYYSSGEAKDLYSDGKIEAGNAGFRMLIKATFLPEVAAPLMVGWKLNSKSPINTG